MAKRVDLIIAKGIYSEDRIYSKYCTACGELKPESEYHKNKDGLQRRCKPCHILAAKKQYEDNPEYGRLKAARWREKNPERAKLIAYRTKIRTKYGITLEEYEERLNKQKYTCAICKTSDPGDGVRQFSVDHDHATGEVRGLLCRSCNSGLGHFKDNVNFLAVAIDYLKGTAKR